MPETLTPAGGAVTAELLPRVARPRRPVAAGPAAAESSSENVGNEGDAITSPADIDIALDAAWAAARVEDHHAPAECPR